MVAKADTVGVGVRVKVDLAGAWAPLTLCWRLGQCPLRSPQFAGRAGVLEAAQGMGGCKSSMKRQNDRILKEELPRSVGAQYATGDQWRNNSRKNEGMEPKQKHHY